MLRYLAAIALLTSPALTLADTAQQSDFDLPAPAAVASPKKLWATHYYVLVAASAPTGIPFRDAAGNALSDNISPRDWCLAAIEGTVQVNLGTKKRTLNYDRMGAQQVDCKKILKANARKKPWITSTGKSYFKLAKGPFGDGVNDYRLVPLRTIAVDNSVIPYGSVIYVPAARGTTVEIDGQKLQHDGYFFAGDTGGAIKGNHVDVFCGATTANCLPGIITSNDKRTFDAIVITDASIVDRLRAQHEGKSTP
ncbi:3D domain-containing protein [Pandoraea pneumonica]|uniref:3D domain-containing protein n=1 Tax=Pandoraea pneumonica TaxID=2508299 RepID=UPI003CF82A95